MTRSASRRYNDNARQIAAAVPISTLTASFDRYGAFTADGARRFAPPFADLDRLDEVSWELCAQVLNERAWRCA